MASLQVLIPLELVINHNLATKTVRKPDKR